MRPALDAINPTIQMRWIISSDARWERVMHKGPAAMPSIFSEAQRRAE